MALNNEFGPHFGMSTCVDMRQLMNPKERNPSNSQNFTAINILAINVTPKMNIRQVAKLFRQDLNQKIKNGGLFIYDNKSCLKSLAYQSQIDSDFIYDNKNRSIADISNIGRFKINDEYSKLITDVWIQQKNQALNAESFVGLVPF